MKPVSRSKSSHNHPGPIRLGRDFLFGCAGSRWPGGGCRPSTTRPNHGCFGCCRAPRVRFPDFAREERLPRGRFSSEAGNRPSSGGNQAEDPRIAVTGRYFAWRAPCRFKNRVSSLFQAHVVSVHGSSSDERPNAQAPTAIICFYGRKKRARGPFNTILAVIFFSHPFSCT